MNGITIVANKVPFAALDNVPTRAMSSGDANYLGTVTSNSSYKDS